MHEAHGAGAMYIPKESAGFPKNDERYKAAHIFPQSITPEVHFGIKEGIRPAVEL